MKCYTGNKIISMELLNFVLFLLPEHNLLTSKINLHTMKTNYLVILIALLIGTACTQQSTEVAQWRGENRDGIYNETELLKSWPEKGPALAWEYEGIGHGYGSPAVTSEKLLVNGEIDSISYLFAFDLQGQILWKSENGAEFMGEGFAGSFPGSRSTPTVIDSLVYTCSGLGQLACYSMANGKKKWSSNMAKEFSGKPNYFGYAESPLVVDDKVFFLPGGKDSNIVALNRFSGEPIWISKALSDTASYNSPIVIELATRKILVAFTIHNLLGLDISTGELLWSHKQKVTKFNQPSNTPIYKDGFIYYAQADGNGVVKLKLAEDGSSVEQIWRQDNESNTFKGFIVKDDKVWATNSRNRLKAFSAETGEVTDSLKIKGGTLIMADNMIYCYSENGSVNLIANTDSVFVVSKFKIKKGTKEHFSTPYIKNGVIYIRHGNVLMAYNIKAKE